MGCMKKPSRSYTRPPGGPKQKPVPVITDREVNRFIRAAVALIRRGRVKVHLTVEDVAPLAGLSPHGWRNIERGKRKPLLATLVRMIVGLNLSILDGILTLQGRKIQHLRRIGSV